LRCHDNGSEKGVRMHVTRLPDDQALVLQQVAEDGEGDFASLVESLRFDYGRLSHIVESLQHKGLVVLNRAGQSESWIRLSSKGRRLLAYMWPESGLSPSY
ncbi:MAG TPA: MarR family winged helix-turn-helix transcriptional regulator, partial [Candidatus Saccharimonadales bacterium]|nr:MarR family winged helix-turn-helix transcriptional regulator [Candidatus Saccharimonadales bacterium]